MLVKGSRESLSSNTTSVRVSRAGSIRVNFIICPGNHDGGAGSTGERMSTKPITSAMMKGMMGFVEQIQYEATWRLP